MDSERVRADLARLGRDEASAPGVPPAVTEQVVSALRAAPAPEHKPRRRTVRLSAAVGVVAVVAAAGVGTIMLVGSDPPATTKGGAQHLNTEPPSAKIPLSDAEILGLLTSPPDLGPLGDPRRRSLCLSGLGYPGSTEVLGGRQIAVLGEPAVLLVLPGDTPTTVTALAVRPNCSAANTGLLADTRIPRPSR